jgi:hypothetical protein
MEKQEVPGDYSLQKKSSFLGNNQDLELPNAAR